MEILVACEESQAVTIEMRRLGHEAYSCDIEPCSGGHPEWHIMQDVIPLINGRCKFKTMDGKEHPYTKKTCLWERGVKPLVPVEPVQPIAAWCPSGSYSHKHQDKHRGMFTTDRAKNRAKTFPGIAKAMAEQWAGDIREGSQCEK